MACPRRFYEYSSLCFFYLKYKTFYPDILLDLCSAHTEDRLNDLMVLAEERIFEPAYNFDLLN